MRKGKFNRNNQNQDLFSDKIVSPKRCPICIDRTSFDKVYLYYSVSVSYLGQTVLKGTSCLAAQRFAEESKMSKVIISESYTCPCCSYRATGRVKTYKSTAMDLITGL